MTMSFYRGNPPECPCGQVLNPEERVAAGILYWARNKDVGGLKDHVQKNWCVGPSGVKGNGFWHPTGAEACDHVMPNETPWIEDNAPRLGPKGKRLRPDPWSHWRHCRTMGHCAYLVQHRPAYVMYKLSGRVESKGTHNCPDRMIEWFLGRQLPIVVAEGPAKHTAMQIEFAADILSGTQWMLEAYMEGRMSAMEFDARLKRPGALAGVLDLEHRPLARGGIPWRGAGIATAWDTGIPC